MPDGISFQLEYLLSNMLDIDPEMRPTAAELLNHPWIAQEAEQTTMVSGEPDKALVDKVESLIATLKARSTGKK
jgi:serine/threonine protein kinase